MKLFHVRFDTESGDHWSEFVSANSKEQVKDALQQAESLARKNIGVSEDRYCNLYVEDIEEVKSQPLNKFKKDLVGFYEQELE